MSSRLKHQLARAALSGLQLPDPEEREHLLRRNKIVDLVSNTNPYEGALACYPPSHPVPIQERYANFLRQELCAAGVSDVALGAEHVLFTCGSVEGISLLVAAFCEPFKDCVCVCKPTFPFYDRAARCNDVAVQAEPLQGNDLNRFDVGAVLTHGPKLTFLCSPSNPVGTTLDPTCIVDLLRSTKGLVVVDEAYLEFSTRPSVLRWLPSAKRLVVLRTFSKAWGLAGARIGAVIADPLILHTLRLVQLTYAFSALAQQQVLGALAKPARMTQNVKRIRAERDRLARELSSLPIVERVYSSDANFLFVAFYDVVAAYNALLEAGVLVGDTRHQMRNTLRISIGISEHCKRVTDVLQRLVPTQATQ